jgi:hypothetical protein
MSNEKKTKGKRGAKGKYNQEIVDEIAGYVQVGNTVKDACTLVGISTETYFKWLREKPEFADAIKKAEAKCKARNIARIQQATEKSWQAAAWWLERKYRNEFAIRQEVTGGEGKPLKIEIAKELIEEEEKDIDGID